MNHPILSENESKKLNQPLWMLVCFAMFVFWQMGFIYFVGPSLVIDNKTPLPIDMNNATALIAVCYVLSILWMIFLPGKVIWTQRIATAAALITAVGLFLPLPDSVLRLFIYVQIFCCCLIIGFETFIMVNYFSEKSNICHLTFAYGVALVLIAVLQNEFILVTFSTFRFIMAAALVLLLLFFFRMPVNREAQPRYVKKSDGLTAPKKLLFGTYIFVFICALMGVSGPAIAGEIRHGVFITYFTDALISFTLYLLYIKVNLHPFRIIPVLVGLGSMGFFLIFASTRVPQLSYISCGLIGAGMATCQMIPLYGAVIMKSYPSRYISPIIIGLALMAVLIQGSMVEIFRTAPEMLYLVYAVIMAALAFIYMQIEPFFLFTLRRRIAAEKIGADDIELPQESAEVSIPSVSSEESREVDDPLTRLTKREREVAELICLGHSNADIAKMLFISENTVKDHTKKIYPKMGVHSRLELAALVGKWKEKEN